jgi:hypothetical protein
MLGDKDRTAAEGRLLAVVHRLGRRKALVDEIARVLEG